MTGRQGANPGIETAQVRGHPAKNCGMSCFSMTKVVQDADLNKMTAARSLHESEMRFIQHRLMFSQEMQNNARLQAFVLLGKSSVIGI